jgi:hypothetical protein
MRSGHAGCILPLVVENRKLMNKPKILKAWSAAVGAMDAVTGLLLVVSPATVLKLLDITPPSAESLVFLSWIGVFVMGVGLSYGLALGRRGRGEAVWMFTAMVRILVATFLTFRILDGSLPKAWFVVAFADASVALVQGFALRAGWWKEVPK